MKASLTFNGETMEPWVSEDFETEDYDPALIRFDAPELRAAVAEALVEFRKIASDIAEMIGPLEARIAALEAKLNKDGMP